MTLQERQEIARKRYRDVRRVRWSLPQRSVHHSPTLPQARAEREAAWEAQLAPRARLPAAYIRSAAHPHAPALWYGLPVAPEVFRAYVARKGNPEGADLASAPLLAAPSAMRLQIGRAHV